MGNGKKYGVDGSIVEGMYKGTGKGNSKWGGSVEWVEQGTGKIMEM